mmetsp:Transcript_6688/g.15276  ORF Transcript_6688/g.15276 Transcript_6688/m.15276 type:complete len:221 (-) Transcript_6688:255-917(-)
MLSRFVIAVVDLSIRLSVCMWILSGKNAYRACCDRCLNDDGLHDIQVKFRDYAKAIAETKANMSGDAANAFFSMTQAEYAAGNFKQKVAEGTLTARVRVGAGVDNVAGVKLPIFSKYDTGVVADNQSLGLAGGGKKIQSVREKFTYLLEMLIKLASLQTSFQTLDEALKGKCTIARFSTSQSPATDKVVVFSLPSYQPQSQRPRECDDPQDRRNAQVYRT